MEFTSSRQKVNSKANRVPTILRVGHKRGSYSRLCNKMLQDSRLTMVMQGVLTRVLSYADNWEFTYTWLRKQTKLGKNKAYAIVAELEKLGYCKRETVRDARGRVSATVYIFTDDPDDPLPGNGEMDGKVVTTAVPGIREPVDGEPATDPHKTKKQLKRNEDVKAPPPQAEDRRAEIDNLLKSGLKRGPSPNIDRKLLESARGLGVPVEMIEAGIQGPNISNPSGLFRSHCAKWICGQLPKLHPSIANSALAGRGQHYQTVLNLMTMRQAVR